ncbi:hypothetical protein PR202_ga07610 [Eleusine coracana subsp. coracana]|uniref:Uncharacterized protein n=1 Tax=Eleusine coracana subsp. coracana TaxID=191504 RepID=A0AAV5BYG7_ELECO|nr:hypothetical protein PR202_ga07610 [Eleusine coracana subsp. coracana]
MLLSQLFAYRSSQLLGRPRFPSPWPAAGAAWIGRRCRATSCSPCSRSSPRTPTASASAPRRLRGLGRSGGLLAPAALANGLPHRPVRPGHRRNLVVLSRPKRQPRALPRRGPRGARIPLFLARLPRTHRPEDQQPQSDRAGQPGQRQARPAPARRVLQEVDRRDGRRAIGRPGRGRRVECRGRRVPDELPRALQLRHGSVEEAGFQRERLRRRRALQRAVLRGVQVPALRPRGRWGRAGCHPARTRTRRHCWLGRRRKGSRQREARHRDAPCGVRRRAAPRLGARRRGVQLGRRRHHQRAFAHGGGAQGGVA